MEPTNHSAPLVEAVLQMMTLPDQKSLFEYAIQTARQQLQVERISLVLFNPSRRDVQAIFGTNLYENTPAFNVLWEGLEGWVVREQNPTLVADPKVDVRVSSQMRLALENIPGDFALAAAPCGSNGVLMAVGAGLERSSVEVLNTIGKTATLAETKLEARPQELTIPHFASPTDIYWQSIGLIGQGAQQVQLTRALGNTEAGNGSVLLITGQPGSGKTALAEWFVRQAQSRNFEVIQSVVKRHSVQYEVWRHVLTQLYPDLPRTLEGSRAFLRKLNDKWEGRAGLLLHLLQAGHINDPSLQAYTVPQRHEAVTTLIIDLLALASQHKPLVIVFEDVDELGEGSRDVLHRLSHRLKFQPSRLVMVATSSSDLPGDFTRLTLQPLHAEHVTQVRQALAGDQVAPILDEWLLAQTRGNPLFLRLLIGSLVESNQLMTPPPTAGSLSTVIQALIKQLAPNLKTTLCAAAVIGSPFSLKELAAVHPQHPAEDALLPDLKQLSVFVKPLVDGRLAFRHRIYNEEILGICESAQRQEMHATMAEYLERNGAAQAGQIAYHYQHSRLPQQARPHLIRAANVAHSRQAYQDALFYIRQNLSLPGTLDDMEAFTILSEQADLYSKLGDYEKQAPVLGQLSDIAQRVGDPWLHAESGWRWLQHYNSINQPAEGIATWKPFLTQAEKAGHTVARAEIMIAAALLYQQMGHFEDSQTQLDTVSTLAGQARNYVLGSRILLTLGNVFEQNARYDLAQACYEQALEIYRTAGNQVGVANAHADLGRMYFDLGYFNMSQTHLQATSQIWEALGNLSEQVESVLLLIELKLMQQRYQEATSLANDIRLSVEQLADPRQIARWWFLYGQIYRGFGNREQALESYRKALNTATETELAMTQAALAQVGDTTHLELLHRLPLTHRPYPSQLYTTLANVTRDPQQQAQIVTAGRQHLEARAAKIEDEQIRQQYLSRPDRRALLEYRAG